MEILAVFCPKHFPFSTFFSCPISVFCFFFVLGPTRWHAQRNSFHRRGWFRDKNSPPGGQGPSGNWQPTIPLSPTKVNGDPIHAMLIQFVILLPLSRCYPKPKPMPNCQTPNATIHMYVNTIRPSIMASSRIKQNCTLIAWLDMQADRHAGWPALVLFCTLFLYKRLKTAVCFHLRFYKQTFKCLRCCALLVFGHAVITRVIISRYCNSWSKTIYDVINVECVTITYDTACITILIM